MLSVAFALVAPVVAAAAPSVVGSWTLMGVPFATFEKNGTCVVMGEACTWKAENDTLVVSAGGESDVIPFAVTATTLTLVGVGDGPVMLQRAGAPPTTQTPTTATTPTTPQAPQATNAPALDVKDPLAKLLLSTAWCSFRYNKNTGYSSSTRVQYFADGTWSDAARGEGYSSGAGGTFASQADSSSRGRWSVAKGQFWFGPPPQAPGLPPPPLFPVVLRITDNGSGAPIIKTPDGREYMRCE